MNVPLGGAVPLFAAHASELRDEIAAAARAGLLSQRPSISSGERGMQRIRWRAAGGVLVVAAAALLAAIAGSSQLGSGGAAPLLKGGDPDALGNYKTIIGPEGRLP